MTELTTEQINLAIAKIAGWTNIHEWNPNPKEEKPVKTWQGTNEAHPELGTFIPKYTEDLGAIISVFLQFSLLPELVSQSAFIPPRSPDQVEWIAIIASSPTHSISRKDTNPAIALCKLLLAINPDPIVPKVAVIEATFG